jgi:hypothetical protein
MTAREFEAMRRRNDFLMPEYLDRAVGRTCAVLAVLLFVAASFGMV